MLEKPIDLADIGFKTPAWHKSAETKKSGGKRKRKFYLGYKQIYWIYSSKKNYSFLKKTLIVSKHNTKMKNKPNYFSDSNSSEEEAEEGMKMDDEEVDLKKADDSEDDGWTLVKPKGLVNYIFFCFYFLWILDKFSFRGKINRIFDGKETVKETNSTTNKGSGNLAKNDSEIPMKKKRRR